VPLPDNVNPAGNEPLAKLHVTGASPDAVNVVEYEDPIEPLGSEEVVITGATGGGGTSETTIDSDLVSFPVALLAWTTKVAVSAVVGVPLIMPLPDKDNPAGKLPLAKLHVIGVSPVAAKVSEYAAPTVAPASDVVVIVGASGAGEITMLNALVSSPTGLAALTVKE